MAYVGKHRNPVVMVEDLDEPGLFHEWGASDFEPEARRFGRKHQILDIDPETYRMDVLGECGQEGCCV